MAKQITFEFEGKGYTLEFTRSTVRRMERNGFDVSAGESRPMSIVYDLFAGAFQAHHRNIDSRLIDRMFDGLTDLDGWANDLIEMYQEPFTSMTDAGEIKRERSW